MGRGSALWEKDEKFLRLAYKLLKKEKSVAIYLVGVYNGGIG